MPKSKRARVVHLSKVDKKGKEGALKLYAGVQAALEEYDNVFVFSVDNMRNNALKQVRAEFSESRIFFGKTKVMAKALGTNPETSAQPNTFRLAAHLSSEVGLLFTRQPPSDILEYFKTYSTIDFARAGTIATRSFTVPAGQVYSRAGEISEDDDVLLAHSIEPELRKLGMSTSLDRGKIVLQNAYVVCKEGQVLDSRQTRLLKLFGVATAEFRLKLVAYWSSATQEVTVVPQEDEDEDVDEMEE